MPLKRINLALQGGGAHGAFTWGVLDRILEDDDIEIAAITGTSAGALNGAAVKAGLARGTRQDARDNLDWMWDQVAGVGDSHLAQWLTDFIPDTSPWTQMMQMAMPFSLTQTAAQLVSPYYYGPLYHNPLKSVVDKFDFETICSDQGPRLFIGATQLRNGKARIFTREEISTDAILASACLPTVFQAIEIEDPKTGQKEAYWDGGYSANPPLHPLYDPDLPRDLVIVNINPMHRNEIPKTPLDIEDRINEISFNAALLRELQVLQAVQRVQPEEGPIGRVLVHMISDDALMRSLSAESKAMPDPALLRSLKESGRESADMFLEDHKPALGVESSVNLDALLD